MIAAVLPLAAGAALSAAGLALALGSRRTLSGLLAWRAERAGRYVPHHPSGAPR